MSVLTLAINVVSNGFRHHKHSLVDFLFKMGGVAVDNRGLCLDARTGTAAESQNHLDSHPLGMFVVSIVSVATAHLNLAESLATAVKKSNNETSLSTEVRD